MLNKYLNSLNEQHDKKELALKIMDFFVKNIDPEDDMVHKFAEDLGMDPDDFEGRIYGVLSSFLSFGRFNEEGKKENDFDSEQIRMGIKVEYEHTRCPIISKRITLDHLTEFPDYYTRLKNMENEAKEYHGKK
jgi:hypothetical protein